MCVIGHSLGGAVATLAAFDVKHYTTPRVNAYLLAMRYVELYRASHYNVTVHGSLVKYDAYAYIDGDMRVAQVPLKQQHWLLAAVAQLRQCTIVVVKLRDLPHQNRSHPPTHILGTSTSPCITSAALVSAMRCLQRSITVLYRIVSV